MKFKHCLSFLMVAAIILCMIFHDMPSVYAAPSMTESVQAGKPALGENRGMENYHYNYAKPVWSYLYANERGGLTRVQYAGKSVLIEEYDSGFNFISNMMLPTELTIWGGFFAGKNYNFFIFGDKNPEESKEKEVVRVVKYSKDWQRLGQTSFFGINTVEPFHAGSLRCIEDNNYLYIRTCHKMFRSRDGLNHQANMSLVIRQEDMGIARTASAVSDNSTGYVSHSFNQFVLIDQNQKLVTMDHGDAYPRSLVMMRYSGSQSDDIKLGGSVEKSHIQKFPGEIGDNRTDACAGGFAETAACYVTAYKYDGGQRTWNAQYNIYFGYTTKDGFVSNSFPITQYTETLIDTPVLAPTGLDGGYILWQNTPVHTGEDYSYARDSQISYVRYTDTGITGEVMTAHAFMSDCQPILYNGEVVWYVVDSYVNPDGPIFYRIDANGVLNSVPIH